MDDKVKLSQLTSEELTTRIHEINKRIKFSMDRGQAESVYRLNAMLDHVEAEKRLRTRVDNTPLHIKDFYYKKWNNLECCFISNYHNLGESWPAFGRTLEVMPNEVIIVPYDKIRFDTDYVNYTLDDHLEYANSTGKFVIIDKSVEHQHDELDYKNLHSKLNEHKLLSKCVVYDNTFTSKKYDEYGIAHCYAPWYVWFYIKFLRIPNFVGKPSYQFLCLNNYDKPHRLAVIKTMHEKNFIKRTQWSYREQANQDNRILHRVKELLPDFDEKNIGFDTPKYLDQAEGKFIQSQNIDSLHADALCSIVNESDFFYSGTKFATEKSLNAIFFASIPIVVSCAGTVDVMRSHGIDVYDDIIDHSYDSVVDPKQRFEEVVKTIEHCASWRDYQGLRSQMATRILRNQMLMTHIQHWQDEIDIATQKFYSKNKISI